jgi:hypothetical protein
MTKPDKAFAVTLPLLEAHSRVSDAVERAERDSAPAIVSTNGKEFWLHGITELRGRQEAETLRALQELEAPNAATATMPDLVFSAQSDGAMGNLFPDEGVAAVIASEMYNFAGERMVLAFTNPAGGFYVVRGVWECPKGHERFSSPGICGKHNVPLVKKN